MAETNITADKVNGQVIQADHVNELKSALVTTLSGRDASGTMTAGQQLGSATYPWGLAYIDSLISNGSLIDFSSLTTESNKIKSGQTRSTSDQADFIRALGTSPAADIQGGTTPLSLVINGSAATVNTTINLTSLTTASSGAASQCNINEVDWTGQEFTKYAGEQDIINIDAVGANITAKVGQVVCLRAGTEYFLAYVKSNTELSNCKRGYFFNSSGLPVVRTVLNNNDTLDLMSLGYVFIEDDGATVEVSYLNPVYSFNEPIGAATGQYWFDLQSSQWRRYDGANFIVINRILTGLVVIDPTNCVASRSLDFDLDYSDLNSIIFNEFDDTIITSQRVDNSISVNANKFDIKNKISFNITTDKVVGVSETADTTYYCYLTQEGQKFIDTERPYQLDPFKKGNYHPYNSWRCLLSFYNDSSSNISSITNIDEVFGVGLSTITNYGKSLLPQQITIENDSGDLDHDILFNAGNFDFDDGSGQAVLSSNLIKQIDAAWVAGNNQGGLFSGTVAANSTYHMFVISNNDGSLVDTGFSTDINAADIPTGYTKKRRIASLRTDASSNIRNGRYIFNRDGSYDFKYNIGGGITDLNTTTLSTGSRAAVPLSCPPNVKANITSWCNDNDSGTMAILLTEETQTDTAASNTNCTINPGEIDSVTFYLKTNSSSEIYYRSNDGGTDYFIIKTLGWIDNNL